MPAKTKPKPVTLEDDEDLDGVLDADDDEDFEPPESTIEKIRRNGKSRPLPVDTKEPKPKKGKTPVQETTSELLKHSLFGFDQRPMTDEELLTEIKRVWSLKNHFHKVRDYVMRIDHAVWSVAIWLDMTEPSARPWLYHDPDASTEYVQDGGLLPAVRKLLSIADPSKPEAKSSTPDKPIISAEKAITSPGELLAGVTVVEEREIPYNEITRSKFNPRQNFDEAMIADMAPTIVTICQLNPLTVREGSFELIDGETRHRAGAVGKAPALRCKVVRCTDAQAACLRLMTSVQRRDLNPVEKAQALQSLLDQHGFTQRQLTEVVKLQQSSIDNLTRLLKLPGEWKQLLISEEITAAAARELVPWIEEPKVLAKVFKEIGKLPIEKRGAQMSALIGEAAGDLSESLEGYHSLGAPTYRSVDIKLNPSKEERELLRIRRFKDRWGHSKTGCFNLELHKKLWEKAKSEAIEKAEKNAKKSASKKGNADPKKAAENAKKQAEMFQKKLYRYKIDWLQTRLVPTIDAATEVTLFKYLVLFCTLPTEEREHDLADLVEVKDKKLRGYMNMLNREAIAAKVLKWTDGATVTHVRNLTKQWLGGEFEGYHAALEPESIEVLAAHAGVDVKRDWPKSCNQFPIAGPDPLTDYLELLGKDHLVDLAAEWKLTLSCGASAKRTELITEVRKHGRGKPAPKALLEVKPIRLV